MIILHEHIFPGQKKYVTQPNIIISKKLSKLVIDLL